MGRPRSVHVVFNDHRAKLVTSPVILRRSSVEDVRCLPASASRVASPDQLTHPSPSIKGRQVRPRRRERT